MEWHLFRLHSEYGSFGVQTQRASWLKWTAQTNKNKLEARYLCISYALVQCLLVIVNCMGSTNNNYMNYLGGMNHRKSIRQDCLHSVELKTLLLAITKISCM